MGELKPNINTSLFRIDSKNMSSKNGSRNISSISLAQVLAEFDSLETIDITNPEQRRELYALFPAYLIETCDNSDWELFGAMGRYDRDNHTFVTGCFDNKDLKFTLISYKWRKKDDIITPPTNNLKHQAA